MSDNGRSRDDDAVTERDPETERSEVAEATEDEANQPGQLMGVFLLFRDLWRLFRGEKQRTRKLRWLFGLLRPYRGRVIVTGIALLIATAAGLAPPYLAGLAIDGVEKGVLEADIGTNRPDAMNHYGLAREASCLYDRDLKPIRPAVKESSQAASDVASVQILDPDLCARYSARNSIS